MISIEIPVKPRGKGSVRGRGRSFYMDEKTRAYMNHLKHHISLSYTGEPLTSPLFVSVYFAFNDSKMSMGDEPKPMTKKPDIDNLCKALFDSLTGVVWKDDNQVSRLEAHKITVGDSSKIILNIEEIK